MDHALCQRFRLTRVQRAHSDIKPRDNSSDTYIPSMIFVMPIIPPNSSGIGSGPNTLILGPNCSIQSIQGFNSSFRCHSLRVARSVSAVIAAENWCGSISKASSSCPVAPKVARAWFSRYHLTGSGACARHRYCRFHAKVGAQASDLELGTGVSHTRPHIGHMRYDFGFVYHRDAALRSVEVIPLKAAIRIISGESGLQSPPKRAISPSRLVLPMPCIWRRAFWTLGGQTMPAFARHVILPPERAAFTLRARCNGARTVA